MELFEAQLLRILFSLFGKERVFLNMSALLVVMSGLEEENADNAMNAKTSNWAKLTKCSYTIIDHNDKPKLVLELFENTRGEIDSKRYEDVAKLRPFSLVKRNSLCYLNNKRTFRSTQSRKFP